MPVIHSVQGTFFSTHRIQMQKESLLGMRGQAVPRDLTLSEYWQCPFILLSRKKSKMCWKVHMLLLSFTTGMAHSLNLV